MSNKVVMLGLDACDVELVKTWVEQGELPYFRKLIQQTPMIAVSSSCAAMSGSIWPSFFTAKTPDFHGMYYMLQMDDSAYNIKKTHARDLKCPPFWSVLKDNIRCTIVDVPKLGLVETGNNVQVVEWGAADHYSAFQTYPSQLANELRQRFGSHTLKKEFIEPTCNAEYQALFKALYDDIEHKVALCEFLLERDQPDLFIAVLGETHSAGHYFWHLHEPENGEVIPADLQQPLLKLYKKLDACLQRLDNSLDSNTNLFIFSGHGMVADDYPRWALNAVLEKMEMLHTCNDGNFLGNAGPINKQKTSWLNRTTETFKGLARQFLIPQSIQTKLWLSKIQRDIDFTRSLAWAMPSDLQGCIRINLLGREPKGTVAAKDYQQTVDHIVKTLKGLKNADTGEPIVDKIFRIRDVYSLGDYAEILPDIAVLWTNQKVDRISCESLDDIIMPIAERIRSGNHRPNGFCFAKGPDINQQHRCNKMDLMDLGPTVLNILGHSTKANEFIGRPLAINR